MPIITERQTTTNIVLNEDSKFTLGVFDKETIVEETDKVIFLGSIPILGKLFSKEVSQDRKSKIVVFVTPEVKSIELTNANILDGNEFDADPILKENPTDFADTAIGEEETRE
jgi:type IV pilus assembly protein PilQ